MAAASDPYEVLRSTDGKANFQRVARLLISGGTSLLREIFDAIHSPSNLLTILNNSVTKKQLKAAKLTKPQWDCLYPSTGVCGKSTDFDITLLFRLLRTICNLTPPPTGWDSPPASTDQSLTANLTRVKYFRNSVYGHVNEGMQITDDEFKSLWQEISEALVRIAEQISLPKKTAWQGAIAKFLKDPLTIEDDRNVQELVRWYQNDVEVKKSLDELRTTTQKNMSMIEAVIREETQDTRKELKTTTQEGADKIEAVVRLEAQGIRKELKTTTQEGADKMEKVVREQAKDIKEELKSTTDEGMEWMETVVQEGARDIKNQLGEMHQSIDRLNASSIRSQSAGVRLQVQIDCEATTGLGTHKKASEVVVTSQEPHAAVHSAMVEPINSTQEVLNLIASKYLQTLDPSTPEAFSGFLQYMEKIRKVIVVEVKTGSLIITVECSSLQILDELWDDYCTGHLNEMAQTFLVTEDILNRLGLIAVKLTTTIVDDEYKACRGYFLKQLDLLYSPKSSYLVVVAIDFGTTYSGFAFSFIKNQGKDSVFMNRGWVNEHGGRTSKTPTCLLLKDDLSFDSFGYEAVEKYADLQDESSEKRYYFFQHFKMALHNDQTVNAETVIRAANGKSVKAKTVFSRSIRFLKDEALKVIRERTGHDYNVSDIQWVLTVPAIWTPVAKQFMREAAYEAGLGSSNNPEQIMIALEPEAAALSCLEKNMSDFQSETGSRSLDGLLSQPNTHYIVVDIGGGTLDVTVHEIKKDGSIKEVHKVTGGPYGGIKVNEEFEKLLDELFGAENIRGYRQKYRSDWLSMMNEFEDKKRGKRILDADVMTNMRLPRSFVYLASKTQTRAMQRYGSNKVKLKNDEYLALSSGMMKKMFSPTLECIKDHLKKLLQESKLSKVKTMLLVGGFADSALLQEEIKGAFSGRVKVLVPNHADIAVVQGAALFGKKPAKITERVVSTTYGAGCSQNFVHGVHPEEKKFIADDIEKCNDLFYIFVRENSSVRIGQKVTTKYKTLRANKTEINFNFYSASKPDSQFITDPGMRKLGNVTIESPDTWRGKGREIEVTMYFGGTEITATARDVSSGNVAQTTLDFLHR